jgi:hypothetical protein
MNPQTNDAAAPAGAALDERLRRRLATYATAGPAATQPWDAGDARRTTWAAIEPAAPPAATAAPLAELPRTLPELSAERNQRAWRAWQGYAQALSLLLAGFVASFGGVFAALLLLAHVRA